MASNLLVSADRVLIMTSPMSQINNSELFEYFRIQETNPVMFSTVHRESLFRRHKTIATYRYILFNMPASLSQPVAEKGIPLCGQNRRSVTQAGKALAGSLVCILKRGQA